jgi:hypothetical protein
VNLESALIVSTAPGREGGLLVELLYINIINILLQQLCCLAKYNIILHKQCSTNMLVQSHKVANFNKIRGTL